MPFGGNMKGPAQIDFERLLRHCEKALQSGKVDEWTGAEKTKFALYVKYLDNENNENNAIVPERRIKSLANAVVQHNMDIKVDKGIDGTRSTKKLLLDRLKELHGPDPEWLAARPSEGTMVEDLQDDMPGTEREKAISTHDSWEESNDMDEKDTSFDIEPSRTERRNSAADGMRHRRQKRLSAIENDTANVDEVLDHHRQLHDELTADLSRMANQLKFNSLTFGETLAKDGIVMRDAQEAMESNRERMGRERRRLGEHYSKSWGTSLLTCGSIMFVCIMFFLVFFTIRFLPKA